MNPQLELLISLQNMDTEAQGMERALNAIPGQIQAGTTERDLKKQRVEKAQGEIDSLKKKRKDLERGVQDQNDHMAKIKTKLPNVKTNKEYSAILTEVDAVKEKIAQLEDQELEIMETLEQKESEFPAIKAQLDEEEAHFKEYKTKKENEAQRVKGEIQALEDRRQQITRQVEPTLLKRYEKISKARDGIGVVGLKGMICQGCHQSVLPQMMIKVKAGKEILDCMNCLRMLFWVEEPESETAASK